MKKTQTEQPTVIAFGSCFSTNLHPVLLKIGPHVLLVAFMVLVAMIGAITFPKKIAEKFDVMESISGPVANSNEDESIIHQFKIEKRDNIRLLGQLKMANDQIRKYYIMMEYFYSMYYMSLSIMLVFTIVSAITLVFISKNGWDQVNRYIITVFFTAVAISIYYGAFPQVFQHTKNISDNKDLFLQNVKIKNEIISYMATGEDKEGKGTALPKFIHYIDKKLEESNKIPLGFDETKMPDVNINKKMLLE